MHQRRYQYGASYLENLVLCKCLCPAVPLHPVAEPIALDHWVCNAVSRFLREELAGPRRGRASSSGLKQRRGRSLKRSEGCERTRLWLSYTSGMTLNSTHISESAHEMRV